MYAIRSYYALKGNSNIENKLIKVEYCFIGQINQNLIQDILNEITIKPPLSKFGIDPIFKYSKHFDSESDKLFGYTKTNTHSFEKNKKVSSRYIRVISELRNNFV